MDRASGSGVFARDPDALLDLIELEVTDALMKQEENRAICEVCLDQLKQYHTELENGLSQDDMCSSYEMLEYCRKHLKTLDFERLNRRVEDAAKKVHLQTAWRIEGTLREFPKFLPVNVWFDHPIHKKDDSGALKDIQPEEEKPSWKKAMDKRKSPAQKQKERREAVETAFEACGINEKVTLKDLAEYMAVTEKTVRNHLKEHGGFVIEENEVRKKT